MHREQLRQPARVDGPRIVVDDERVAPRACAGTKCTTSGTDISIKSLGNAPRACATSAAPERRAMDEVFGSAFLWRRTRLRSNKWLLQSGAWVHSCEARDHYRDCSRAYSAPRDRPQQNHGVDMTGLVSRGH